MFRNIQRNNSRIITNEYHKYLSSGRGFITIRSKTSVWLCIYVKKLFRRAKCKTLERKWCRFYNFTKKRHNVQKMVLCNILLYTMKREPCVLPFNYSRDKKIQIKLYCILRLPRTTLLIFFCLRRKVFTTQFNFSYDDNKIVMNFIWLLSIFTKKTIYKKLCSISHFLILAQIL